MDFLELMYPIERKIDGVMFKVFKSWFCKEGEWILCVKHPIEMLDGYTVLPVLKLIPKEESQSGEQR